MVKVKELRTEIRNNTTRRIALWKCIKCNSVKEGRSDMKQSTDFCRSCNKKTHGREGKKVYNVWLSMKARCYNPKNNRYKNYGKLGVTVCQEWLIADNFIKWAYDNGFKAEEGERNTKFTIDRIDPNGNYCPENCQIVPIEKQHYNKRVLSASNTTGYRGVSKKKNRYIAQITYKGRVVFRKSCLTAIEAANCRDRYIIDNSLPHVLNNASVEKIQEVVDKFANK